MSVPILLLDVLENLSTDELNKFKWFLGLKILKGCDPILTSYLESPHRQDTVSKMIQSYGEENAVNMTVTILRQMKLNNAAEDLQKSHAEETAAKGKVSRPPISSPASALPTRWKISADGAAGASNPKAPIAQNSRGHFGGIINNGTGGNTGGTAGGNGNIGSNVGSNVGQNVGAGGNVDRIFGDEVGGNSNVTISGNADSTIGSNVRSNVSMNYDGGKVGGNRNMIIIGNEGSIVGSNVGSNVGSGAGGFASGIVGGNSNIIILGNSGSTVGSNVGSNVGPKY